MKETNQKNATLFVKKSKGKLYLYVEATLKNGEVVCFAIKQAFYNAKFDYKLKQNLELR